MEQPLILHIESATDVCSVSLTEATNQIALVESGPERSHAKLLNSFIKEALASSKRAFNDLNAVAVSKGPGSYTGLRIGVSTAKGIAYALDIPLISCGTLENMAYGALAHPFFKELSDRSDKDLLLCPMLDARRMEVYTGFYSTAMEPVRDISADILEPASYKELLDRYRICFIGSGAGKFKDITTHPHAYFLEPFAPSAGYMQTPVLQRYRNRQFEDVAYFEPFYLKDFVPTKPRKKI